ncbi:MAG: hypothetical protein WC712_06770 [Candidatus Brocadiia bacterium]
MKKAIIFAALMLAFACPLFLHAESDDVHNTIDEKLLNLRFGTAVERIQIMAYFGALRDKEVVAQRAIVPLIIKILKDGNDDARVREAAAEAIGELVRNRVIVDYGICQDVNGPVCDAKENILVRAACIRLLGVFMRIWPGEARNELFKKSMRDLLDQTNAPNASSQNAILVAVIETLCKLGDSSAESAIKMALARPDLIDAAVESLWNLFQAGGKITDVNVCIRLLDAVTNTEVATTTRIKAGECLCFLVRSGIGTTYSLDKVIALLNNPATDAQLIPIACKILFTINNTASFLPIVNRLSDDKLSEETREKMISILADFIGDLTPDENSIKAVNVALSNFSVIITKKNPATQGENLYSVKLRWVAAFATGQVKPGFNRRGAFSILRAALEDSDESVRKCAHGGLMNVTKQDFGYNPEAWSKWYEKNPGILN